MRGPRAGEESHPSASSGGVPLMMPLAPPLALSAMLNLLRITDHMKAFVSQRMSGEEELRSRLEQAEASLSAARRASEESAEA
ncbi:hypothetical protein CK203_061702 [Vitis vinifera]|uniref:Uncharacterized protein n=1 Tax=Vitis vinifera TaxID=29760 RepID=A0A438G892_VITVI|nr:hypothetical protein CK203_061702 [Vitis vinifera]